MSLLSLGAAIQKEPGSREPAVRLSKGCKHEQRERRVSVISGKSHATLPLRSKGAAAKPRRSLAETHDLDYHRRAQILRQAGRLA